MSFGDDAVPSTVKELPTVAPSAGAMISITGSVGSCANADPSYFNKIERGVEKLPRTRIIARPRLNILSILEIKNSHFSIISFIICCELFFSKFSNL